MKNTIGIDQVTPLVSIIIPVKNGLPQFRRVIEMLSRQKFDAEFEVIVIDSGSRDGSKEIVPQDDPRFRLIEISSADFGHGKTRNLGASLARGEFCAFLTHDAVPADEYWLAELVKPLRENDEVAGVFGRHIAYPDASPFTRWELETHFFWPGQLAKCKNCGCPFVC
ncbi:glycosyltransferase family 2 protein [Phyllobacterium sp. 628]|uniref:glycosyltransferase family 2 protein n=1 Tax=Phyllobacterium sp. 628 TaxID=2718938 RepID=UPI00166226B2|nr:glycosyltransferase family A protein [Phyllobacterium sp. 628]QND52685.1 glycosyltransferase family 2 protein [Phyllobacterium sp. 628]